MKRLAKEKLIDPLMSLLKRGVSPATLALSMTLGIIFAIVPVFGATTILCLAAISLFRINPLATLLVNQIAYPLQFVLYIPFIRAGEWLYQVEHLPLSVSQILDMFSNDTLGAISTLWWSTLYAITIWLIISIPVGYVLFLSFKLLFSWISSRKKVVPAEVLAPVIAETPLPSNP